MRITTCRVAAALMVLFFPLPVFSCGTIEGWVKIYNNDVDAPSSGYSQKEALEWILKCPYYYGNTEKEKDESDVLLLPIVLDAFSRSPEIESQFSRDPSGLSVQKLLQEIFSQYRCLSGAGGAPGYEEALKKIGAKACAQYGVLE
jgi:hypothetical protein